MRCVPGHLFLSALLLVGCAGQPAVAPLPAPMTLPGADTQQQRLTFEHQQQRHELIGVLRHDGHSLRLIMLSPQGQRLLTLQHDESGARFIGDTTFDPGFSASWLASRLTWSLWPSPALQQSFAGSQWTLSEAGNRRTIRYRNRVIAYVDRSADCFAIDDIEGGYRLLIASLDDSATRTTATCPIN